MSESFPEKYERLSTEFEENLGRQIAPADVGALQQHFEKDLCDWMYEQIWPYFRGIPIEEWSQHESITSEWKCRNSVGLFQSLWGAAEANKRSYIPPDKTDWYAFWLLRLNLGDRTAQEAMELSWLPQFKERDHDGQLQVFAVQMGFGLPEIKGQFFMLYSYAPTLDLRIQATISRLFGDNFQSQKLHDEAVAMDKNLNATFDQYFNGGGVWYVLESDQGMMLTRSKDGSLFNIWSMKEYAEEINDSLCQGTHKVSPMSFRELETQLQAFESKGMRYVYYNRRSNSNPIIVPISKALEIIRTSITEYESTEVGTAIKRGLSQ